MVTLLTRLIMQIILSSSNLIGHSNGTPRPLLPLTLDLSNYNHWSELPEELVQWLIGFFDGECSFGIGIQGNTVKFRFSIRRH
jgi:hypothetical protein